ncbi:hypothetical protein [Microbulbifer elongatus]|uniref:hypothetical protein n=1 Tax=Microbulbifer elongatus TaxID=86173 RepID=UPI001CFD1159|nr:hypothetical protein [Microbulbifer elongatus]
MGRIITCVMLLLVPVGLVAHPDWNQQLDLKEGVSLTGNVRAFVADSGNSNVSDGTSWNGAKVHIELPKEYAGKWITLLYRDEPLLKDGSLLKLGDTLHFTVYHSESVHLDKLNNLKVLSVSELIQLYEAERE